MVSLRRTHPPASALVFPLTLLTAIAVIPSASAHVTVEPLVIAGGTSSIVRFSMPNERPPHATVKLTVTLPDGWTVLSAEPTRAWKAAVVGRTITWSGGRLTGRAKERFSVELRPDIRAGTYVLAARQQYDDETVRWQVLLTTLPASGAAAPKEHLGRALLFGMLGLLVIVAGLGSLRRFGRRKR